MSWLATSNISVPLEIQEEIPIPGRLGSVDNSMEELIVLDLYVPPYVLCACSRAVCSMAGMMASPNIFAIAQLLSDRSPATKIVNPMLYSGMTEMIEL